MRGRGARGRGTHLNSVNNVSDADTEDDIPLREGIVRQRVLGHIARPRTQGRAVRRGEGTSRPQVNEFSSSEDEFQLNPAKRRCEEDKYDSGMMVRKKFGRRYFDGEIVSKYDENGSNRWHVKYTDGDSEDFSDDELKVHIEQYNRKYNR